MITTLLAFITSKGHRLLESFSTSEGPGKHPRMWWRYLPGSCRPPTVPRPAAEGGTHGEGVAHSSWGLGRRGRASNAHGRFQNSCVRWPPPGLYQKLFLKMLCISDVCDSREQDCATSMTPPRTKTIHATKWPVTCPEKKWNSPVESTWYEVFLN